VLRRLPGFLLVYNIDSMIRRCILAEDVPGSVGTVVINRNDFHISQSLANCRIQALA